MVKFVNKTGTVHYLVCDISGFIIVMYNYIVLIPAAVVVVVVSVLAVDADVVVPVVVLAVVCDLLTDVVAGVLLSVTHTDIHISTLLYCSALYTTRQVGPSVPPVSSHVMGYG